MNHLKRIEFAYDPEQEALLIRFPDRLSTHSNAIKNETLRTMTFEQAAAFIGEKVLLQYPVYHEMFKDYLWTEDGTKPPAKS